MTCQANGARAPTQHMMTKTLESPFMFFDEQPVEHAGRESENCHRRHCNCGSVAEIQVTHVVLIGIHGHSFGCAAGAASSHYPHEIEDRESLNDSENDGHKNKRQQV